MARVFDKSITECTKDAQKSTHVDFKLKLDEEY